MDEIIRMEKIIKIDGKEEDDAALGWTLVPFVLPFTPLLLLETLLNELLPLNEPEEDEFDPDPTTPPPPATPVLEPEVEAALELEVAFPEEPDPVPVPDELFETDDTAGGKLPNSVGKKLLRFEHCVCDGKNKASPNCCNVAFTVRFNQYIIVVPFKFIVFVFPVVVLLLLVLLVLLVLFVLVLFPVVLVPVVLVLLNMKLSISCTIK